MDEEDKRGAMMLTKQKTTPLQCGTTTPDSRINSLVYELLIRILICLPLKQVVQVKLVCRRWRQLIEDQHFIDLYHTHNPLAYIPFEDTMYIANLNTLESDATAVRNIDHYLRAEGCSHWDFMGPCHGLFCVLSGDSTDTASFFFCNGFNRAPLRVVQPCSSSYLYVDGFGYDCRSKDHKLLRLFKTRSSRFTCFKWGVEVYIWKRDSWKVIQDAPIRINLNHKPSVSAHNCLHWIGSRFIDYAALLLKYDLHDEKFSEVALPDVLSERKFDWEETSGLVILHGDLCFYSAFKDFSIWVLKQSEEKWTKWISFQYTVLDIEFLFPYAVLQRGILMYGLGGDYGQDKIRLWYVSKDGEVIEKSGIFPGNDGLITWSFKRENDGEYSYSCKYRDGYRSGYYGGPRLEPCHSITASSGDAYFTNDVMHLKLDITLVSET